MSDWIIERYTPAFEKEWNVLNRSSRNSTFLTDRRFMDYHADRFYDHSLLAKKNDKILALLPADITSDGILHSHRGLTYGGWILPQRHVDAGAMLQIWDAMIAYCKANGIRELDYKPLPYIFASAPSGEDIYALFRSGARLTECNISSAIRLSDNPGFNKGRRWLLKKALSTGAEVVQSVDHSEWSEFYAVLKQCLDERHDAQPVHSFEELMLLHSRFTPEIQLWVTKVDGKILAGTVLFISRKVIHSQYIATTADGRQMGLITPLFDTIIRLATEGYFGKSVEYFNFGISNEDHGLYLNENLYIQKASMGATGVPFERYSLKI